MTKKLDLKKEIVFLRVLQNRILKVQIYHPIGLYHLAM